MLSGGYKDISTAAPSANSNNSDDLKSPPANPIAEKYVEEDEPLERLYRAWPGRNSPVCCGRCLMGPDRGVWITTLSLILVPTGLFVFHEGSSPSIVVSLFSLITCLSSVYCLCKATFTEPGIIPRSDVRKEPLWKSQEPPKVVLGQSKNSQREVALKYCSTCHIWRPLRSKHCRDCDNCVEKFDHHCPWVCNCVGKRNYRYFIAFIFATTVHCIFVFLGALAVLIDSAIKQESATNAISQHTVASGIVLYTFFVGWCLCGLSGYHLQLISSDTTTNEEIKGYLEFKGSKEGNSFSTNCYNLFCTELPESMIDLNAWVNPEALKNSNNKSKEQSPPEDGEVIKITLPDESVESHHDD